MVGDADAAGEDHPVADPAAPETPTRPAMRQPSPI
jgi:hypothetical protein